MQHLGMLLRTAHLHADYEEWESRDTAIEEEVLQDQNEAASKLGLPPGQPFRGMPLGPRGVLEVLNKKNNE